MAQKAASLRSGALKIGNGLANPRKRVLLSSPVSTRDNQPLSVPGSIMSRKLHCRAVPASSANNSNCLEGNACLHAANEEKMPTATPKVKRTKGRVKIEMQLVENRLRRQATFSKRKTNLLKKAYELYTLTGAEVMVVVASETSHVYTYATPRLQPMIADETGRSLIQTCLSMPKPSKYHSDTDAVDANVPTSLSSDAIPTQDSSEERNSSRSDEIIPKSERFASTKKKHSLAINQTARILMPKDLKISLKTPVFKKR